MRRLAALSILLTVLTPRVPASAPPSVGVHAIRVGAGWNFLSLPAGVSNGIRASLFPTSTSPAFVLHDSGGYGVQDSLWLGLGFWLKFDSAQTVVVQGETVIRDTIELHAGWNPLGSLSLFVAVDSIKTIPSGIISAGVYGYEPGAGYQRVDTMYPGRGHWIKLTQAGSVVLASPAGLSCPGTAAVNYAGKAYTTVQIGSQCWLRENLDVGMMADGSGAQTNNGVIEKYCYGNDSANCSTYGGLYQWHEAMQYNDTSQGARGVCPPGWHIPTLAEMMTLSATVGGDGNALKAIGQGSGTGTGTNTSGFSSLLGGYREINGSFVDFETNGVTWSSMPYDGLTAFGLVLSALNPAVVVGYDSRDLGFSVRCLQGEGNNVAPDSPSHPSPPNGSREQPPSLTLRWSCRDADGDSLAYDLLFGQTNPPGNLLSARQIDTFRTTSGLSFGTTWYWRVVVHDDRGHVIPGPVWSFTVATMGYPCPGLSTVNYAGKAYHTVQIGNECWLNENLDVGTMIEGTGNASNNGIIEKYCYDNDAANCMTFGGLYQWSEAMQYDPAAGVQGICPPGWHMPTSFRELRAAVGRDGNALKAVGQGSGAGAGTNTSGFTALLAGHRLGGDGSFGLAGNEAHFWNATRQNAVQAAYLRLNGTDAGPVVPEDLTTDGKSVRCIANEVPNTPPGQPSIPHPQSGARDVSLSTLLTWSCSDPDGNPLTYDVYLGRTNPPVMKVSSNSADTSLIQSGVTGATWYYWRVVAKDHRDSTLGPVWSFGTVPAGIPCPGIPTVVYAGKTYGTVKIGSYCWLRENLDAGVMIPGSQNQTDDGAIQKYCCDDNPANCDTYGGLYQWHEAMQYDAGQGAQGICPPGWHMPAMAEFETLGEMVGGDGNALKATGQGTGPGAGTNTSGFAALLAGYRSPSGAFGGPGSGAYVWSSTQPDPQTAHNVFLHSRSAYIVTDGHAVNSGLTVRCVMLQAGNFPPGAPTNPSPPSGAANVSSPLILRWSAGDPDGDSLHFDVYIGTTDPPDVLLSSDQRDTSVVTTGLVGYTTYYWTVVARDDQGHDVHGPVWSFNTHMGFPCPGTPTVDYAGRTYNTVQIGNQCWMKENLDVGSRIWSGLIQTDNDTIEKYCYFNNPEFCSVWGGLYQRNEMMQYQNAPGSQGICPPDWHIPTIGEYYALSAAVAGDGNALKAVGQGIGGGAGTNTSGFSALLAGWSSCLDGRWEYLRTHGFYWSSTDRNVFTAWLFRFDGENASFSLDYSNVWIGGASVRCLKD